MTDDQGLKTDKGEKIYDDDTDESSASGFAAKS